MNDLSCGELLLIYDALNKLPPNYPTDNFRISSDKGTVYLPPMSLEELKEKVSQMAKKVMPIV